MPESVAQNRRLTPVRASLLSLLLLGIAAAVIFGRGTPSEAAPDSPKSVIVLIGDGMGTGQRMASQLANYGYDETQPMDALPYAGLSRTQSNAPITDSAAGATAIATGVRTHNNFAGVDADGNNLKTLLDVANRMGKSTGLVDDHDITNATMASFGAHVPNRDFKKKIAHQLAYGSMPDVMFGGGEKLWYTKDDKGKIPDIYDDDGNNGKENLVQKLIDDGYQYAYDRKTAAALTGPQAIGLYQDDAYIIDHDYPDYDKDKDPHFVPEEDSVAKALEILSQNPNGFFLAIENDEMDDAGHEHDGTTAIEMGGVMNRMTEVINEFTATHPDTLFIITADHETGGMNIEGKGMGSNSSYGDGDVPSYGKPENRPGKHGETPPRWGPFQVKGSKDMFKVDWTTPGHTGNPVPVTASGPGAENLTGIYDNTHIHDVALEQLKSGM